MIVLDASMLVDVVLGRPPALAALRETTGDGEAVRLHAPELVELETLSALRRLLQRGEIDPRTAARAIELLGEAPLVRYGHAPMRNAVWALRDRLSAYDAAYLVLTRTLDDAILLTADAGLAAVARELLGPERVREGA